MQSGECKCLTSCNDEKLLLQSTNSFYWLRKPSLHFDLEKTKTTYRRQVIFGWRELLGEFLIKTTFYLVFIKNFLETNKNISVASGATAGLFLGISVLSIVEFVYLQLRPWLRVLSDYLMRRKHADNKKGIRKQQILTMFHKS